MGKGPSVSQERAEIGRHSSGGRPASPLSEGRHQGTAGVREGLGEQVTPEWGLGR